MPTKREQTEAELNMVYEQMDSNHRRVSRKTTDDDVHGRSTFDIPTNIKRAVRQLEMLDRRGNEPLPGYKYGGQPVYASYEHGGMGRLGQQQALINEIGDALND